MISQYSSDGLFDNYGLLVSLNNNIFIKTDKVKSTNYGIVISMNGTGPISWLYATNNRGSNFIGKDGNYNLKNSGSGIIGDTVHTYGTTFDIVKDFKDNNKTEYILNSENIKQTATIGGQQIEKDADNIYINNTSFKLDMGTTLKGKAITTIYQGGGNGIVLNNDIEDDNAGNNDLILDNTTIVGYFEKDGTLLKVDGNLTFGNNSIINAVAKRDDNGDILAEAVAVDVKGNLTYTEGENHIFEIIKGGEKGTGTLICI